MPTAHVTNESHDVLQDIANSLLKARKVVVVTGAGISTNSGIPDFRSENGLYSLIQAQFDAAAQQARVEVENVQRDRDSDETEDDRPAKRRRLSTASESTIEAEQEIEHVREEIEVGAASPEAEVHIEARVEVEAGIEVGVGVVKEEIECRADVICVQGPDTDDSITVQGGGDARKVRAQTAPVLPSITRRVTRSSRGCITVAQPPTSPLSSPPPEDLVVSPVGFRKHLRSRIAGLPLPPSSSPLSSPPPGLFDPYDATSSSDENSAHSTSPSEVDDSPLSTNPFSASQSSFSGRSLPNMKGKDMFDASIWSDPLRTSIFYQFATSLRQKSKDAEPTTSHRFIKHLRDRGKLVRCYTQNIDQIEEKVGLSTCLQDGPGSRGRFSRKSTATINQLAMMVEEASNTDSSMDKNHQSSDESSQQTQCSSDGTRTPTTRDTDQSPSDTPKAHQLRKELRPGVECVYLHGSLERLRCFLCGRLCDWDDGEREQETLSGLQPECPFCVGATIAREEKGKRALGVGKLRPDIVLYGEEHPNSHLISPIITHDLALCPDLLLILGTSLRVHGLKVMVREFAKAVHAKGGKVVFVNFTKPPESSWGDVIDYWIEWDCDAWVADLQDKIPRLWQAPEPPKPKKKRDDGASDDNKKEKRVAANPVALRPAKAVAAIQVLRIVDGLFKATGHPPRVPMQVKPCSPVLNKEKTAKDIKALKDVANDSAKESTNLTVDETTKIKEEDTAKETKKPRRPRPKRPRKSAPGALEIMQQTPSAFNPNFGRTLRSGSVQPQAQPMSMPRPILSTNRGFELVKSRYVKRPLMEPQPLPVPPPIIQPTMAPTMAQLSVPKPSLPAPRPTVSSIAASMKTHPRTRRRKRLYGDADSAAANRRHTMPPLQVQPLEFGIKEEPEPRWGPSIRGYAYEILPAPSIEDPLPEVSPPAAPVPDNFRLAPIHQPQQYSPPHTRSGHTKLATLEPPSHGSPPLGSYGHAPLRPISNNTQRVQTNDPFYLHEMLRGLGPMPQPMRTPSYSPITPTGDDRLSIASTPPALDDPRPMITPLPVEEKRPRRPHSREDWEAANVLAEMGKPSELTNWGKKWPSRA